MILISFLLALTTTIGQQQVIVQKSSGWCSPNIANVRGNVTVTCIGVDPRALRKLNAELQQKGLKLADKIREADQWTEKYKELESRLSAAGDDVVLSKQAEEYLHKGDLDKAGAILDRILGQEETEVDRLPPTITTVD